MMNEPIEIRVDKLLETVSRGGQEARGAFNELRNPDDIFKQALPRIVANLDHANDDVKIVCILALTKLGRWDPDTLKQLRRFTDTDSPSPEVTQVAISCIGELDTSAAAEALFLFLERKIISNQLDEPAVEMCIHGLGNLGSMAAPILPSLYDQLRSFPPESADTFEELSTAYDNINIAIQAAYARFWGEFEAAGGTHSLDPSSQDSSPEPTLEQFNPSVDKAAQINSGFKILYDARVGIPGAIHGVRCIVASTVKQGIVCIVVKTPYLTGFHAQDFPAFLDGFLSHVGEKVNQDLPVQLLVIDGSTKDNRIAGGVFLADIDVNYSPHSSKPRQTDFSLSPVDRDWMKHHIGESFPELAETLMRPPLPPEPFMARVRAQAVERLALRKLYAETSKKNDSVEFYAPMAWEFSEKVKSALSSPQALQRHLSQLPRLSTTYNDSLDTYELSAFPLPEMLRDYLTEVASLWQFWEILHGDGDADELGLLESSLPASVDLSPQLPPQEVTKRARVQGEVQWPIEDLNTSLDLPVRERGIVFIRNHPQSPQVFSNLPITAIALSRSYSWGPFPVMRQGILIPPRSPMLALNILNYFVPPGSDGLPARRMEQEQKPPYTRTYVSATAFDLTNSLDELLDQLPFYGGFISAERIKAFILRNLPLVDRDRKG